MVSLVPKYGECIWMKLPSPKVWRMYLDEVARKGKKNSVLPHSIHGKDALIKGISFRDKCLGWKKYSFALTFSEATADGEKNTVLLSSVFTENLYMNVFLSNLSLRLSCYACPAKAGKSGSDITIADFWGIEDVLPDFELKMTKVSALCCLIQKRVVVGWLAWIVNVLKWIIGLPKE